MLRAGSDKAAELYLEVNRKANDYVRSYEGKIIKGRQIVAMMYESFRTRDRLGMIVSLGYLVKQGDNKLHQFKQTWLEILNRMRQEDIPSEKALRDCLYNNKIKDSPAMKWELGLHYENLSYDVPERSYGNLLNIIDRTIMRRREQSNLTQTQVGLRQMLEGKDLLAAPAKTATPAPNGKPNKGNGKPDDAAPVLPQSKAKAHAKTKAKPKKAARSESTDSKADKSKKHIRCKFHFTDTGCRNGDKCPKTPETPTRSRTPSPSGRTNNQVCFTFRKTGSCSRENCPFKHEAAAATPAAKADAKTKPKTEHKSKTDPSAVAKKTAKSKG